MSRGELLEIKNKKKSIDSIRVLSKSMELASSSKLKKLKKQEYFMKELKERVSKAFRTSSYKIGDEALNIVISSDKSLCGPYNSALFNEIKSSKSTFVLIGNEIKKLIKSRSLDLNIIEVESLEHFLIESIKNSRFKSIDFIYNIYNRGNIEVKRERIFPLEKLEYNGLKYVEDDYLLESYLKVVIKTNTLLALISENYSRMLFMRNAFNSSEEMIEELSRKFNNKRQQLITKDIVEITSGLL